MASLLRAVGTGYVARSAIQAELEASRRSGQEQQRQSHAAAAREHADLQDFVRRLHDEAGIDVRSRYTREGTLRALAAVQRHPYTHWDSVLPLIPVAERIEPLRACAERLIEAIDAARAQPAEEAQPAETAGGAS